MTAKKVLVLSDNEYLLTRFKQLDEQGLFQPHQLVYGYSHYNKALAAKADDMGLVAVNTKKEYEQIIADYDLLVSLHCKQFFPEALVEGMKCLNIHPGLNPHNRGWFPQVFCINNGLPAGATIHEIDKELDHGPIIVQEEVEIESWDTSLTAYNKILAAELRLIEAHFKDILDGNYDTTVPAEGNLNLKVDHEALCELDLTNTGTLEEHINLLRSLTHGVYKNAFFIDKKGNKVFISVDLQKED